MRNSPGKPSLRLENFGTASGGSKLGCPGRIGKFVSIGIMMVCGAIGMSIHYSEITQKPASCSKYRPPRQTPSKPTIGHTTQGIRVQNGAMYIMHRRIYCLHVFLLRPSTVLLGCHRLQRCLATHTGQCSANIAHPLV